MKRILKKIFLVLLLIIFFLDLSLFYGMSWIINNVGLMSIDEVIFHLKVPLTGTSNDLIKDIIVSCVVPVIIIFLVATILLLKKFTYKMVLEIKLFKYEMNIKLKTLGITILTILSVVLFIYQLKDIDNKYKVIEYLKLQRLNSTFIEENYVSPKDVTITFPDKKRNLIYIYLESMETTYMGKETGGNQSIDLIPELTKLALENTNFSNNGLIGGARPMVGTGWTIAGMVAQTAGIPLKMPVNSNNYIGYNKFLPGVYNLGDILNENGYTQVLMVGSDAKFAGRDTYFKTHGNYEIKDYYKAIEEKVIDKDHYVFWGMEDSYLYEWAKTELKELSKKQPFNLTMLTVNTHFPDGYLESSCENKYKDNQYASVIACSSKQVSDFINWIKKQDFYNNTTIVLVGDHLTMAENSILTKKSNPRSVLNIFINSALPERNNYNRQFTSYDMFPTTLASLGVTIEGNRLGLGVNLYSDEKTIIEEFNYNEVYSELSKKSVYYNNNLLYK